MTLFSTTFQLWELFLFLYLGLLSGLIFFASKIIIQKLKIVVFSKLSTKINTGKNSNKKFAKVFKATVVKMGCFLLETISFLIFAGTVIFSFFINVKYNLGNISTFLVFLWIFSFAVGGVFVKTVAKFLIKIYNNFKLKVLISDEK